VTVFDEFSERARRVVFLSRAVAGRQEAKAIDVEHLAMALIFEDQNEFARVMQLPEDTLFPTSNFHKARKLLAPEQAEQVLAKLAWPPEPSASRPDFTTDMPLSGGAGDVLAAALAMVMEKHLTVEPMHLLLAVLEQGGEIAETFKQSGVTVESVRAVMDSGEYF
jgi:ATP-dependent Clp protease ATP-binding subunit ClpA